MLEDINSQLPYNSHSFQSNVLSTLNRSQKENPSENVSSSTADTGKLASSNIKPSPSAIVVPEHLMLVYEQLDWHGQDLDALIIATKLATPQLIGQLMELELLGIISVQGGRYLRV